MEKDRKRSSGNRCGKVLTPVVLDELTHLAHLLVNLTKNSRSSLLGQGAAARRLRRADPPLLPYRFDLTEAMATRCQFRRLVVSAPVDQQYMWWVCGLSVLGVS